MSVFFNEILFYDVFLFSKIFPAQIQEGIVNALAVFQGSFSNSTGTYFCSDTSDKMDRGGCLKLSMWMMGSSNDFDPSHHSDWDLCVAQASCGVYHPQMATFVWLTWVPLISTLHWPIPASLMVRYHFRKNQCFVLQCPWTSLTLWLSSRRSVIPELASINPQVKLNERQWSLYSFSNKTSTIELKSRVKFYVYLDVSA